MNMLNFAAMEAKDSMFNAMQTVKRRFFAMRNGVVADALRRGGSPFRIIFGLNLPQLVEIAAETPHDRDLAERLWSNSTTRESMLIAPMLVDPAGFGMEDAVRWIASVKSHESADVLCHRLLRKLPCAVDLAMTLRRSEDLMQRYIGLRLMFNLVGVHTAEAYDYARIVLSSEADKSLHQLAAMLEEESRFLMSQ